MTTNTITQLTDPQGFSPDPLTDLLRSGAQRLIEQAVEAELSVLLEGSSPAEGEIVSSEVKYLILFIKFRVMNLRWVENLRNKVI